MKDDIENVLTEKARKEIEMKIRKLQVEQEYMRTKLPENARITEIERDLKFNFNELNIDRDISDMTLMKVKEAEKEYYKVLNYAEVTIEDKEVQRVAQKLKLSEEDICDILKTGASLDKIEETGINIIKNSANNQKMISPKELKEGIIEEFENIKQNQAVVVNRLDGKTIVTKVDEIGEVNDKSELELSEDMQAQLRPFKTSGTVKLDEKLYLASEKEPTKEAELGKEVYKAIPEGKIRKKQEKQEVEKEEIAEVLGENSNNIVGIIRVNDRQTCSQILNNDDIKTAPDSVVIVRFKNNKFKAMQENKSGEKKEIVGFKATPAFKDIAPALENKVGNLYSNFNPGDITAGKRVDNHKYDVFYIDTGTRGDGIGNLIVLNENEKNNMDVVRPAECGGYEIEFADAERVYPSTVIMDSKDGRKSKHIHEGNDEIEHDEELEQENQEDVLYNVADGFSGSLAEEKELLEELLRIDNEIKEIENSPNIEIGTTLKDIAIDSAKGYAVAREVGAGVGAVTGYERGVEESKENKKEKIKDLEEKRSKVLDKLGYSKDEIIKAREEAEMMHTHTRR